MFTGYYHIDSLNPTNNKLSIGSQVDQNYNIHRTFIGFFYELRIFMGGEVLEPDMNDALFQTASDCTGSCQICLVTNSVCFSEWGDASVVFDRALLRLNFDSGIVPVSDYSLAPVFDFVLGDTAAIEMSDPLFVPFQGYRFDENVYMKPETTDIKLSSFFTIETWLRFDTTFFGSDNREMAIYEKIDALDEAFLSVTITDEMLVASIGGVNGQKVELLYDWGASPEVWRYVAVTFQRSLFDEGTGTGETKVYMYVDNAAYPYQTIPFIFDDGVLYNSRIGNNFLGNIRYFRILNGGFCNALLSPMV